LNIDPRDRILTTTAGGDRSLHLLLKECQEVIAIDPLPAHTHLLVLKAASLKYLCYEEYLMFLGARPCEKRHPLWDKIKAHLNEESLEFWEKQQEQILEGVLYQGAFEQWCIKFSKFMQLGNKKKLQSLFLNEDLEKQKALIRKMKRLKKIAEFMFTPYLFKIILKDLKLYRESSFSVRPGTYLYQKFSEGLERQLVKKNPLISLFFKGDVSEEAWPPYLTRKGAKLISPRLDRLKMQTADVLSFLKEQKSNQFNAFSFSDIGSCIKKDDVPFLWQEMLRTSKKGARFLVKECLVDCPIPSEISSHFERNYPLEKKLEQEDRSFVFRFLVGTINK
jgi:S-adenosylmethionine-diacylglycerol 3-amino-3-carboxypropyl transferase